MSAGQPVVIGLDGSVHSTRTLAWGLSEARLRGADVVLAHVVPDPADAIRIGWYPLGEDVDADLEGQRYRSDVLRTARDRAPGLAIESRLLRGPTVAALVALAQGAQLVVVGAGGSSDLSRPGTVGMRLVARAPCPVAVVHDPHPGASSRAPVVVGVDGSDCALVAARVAAREAALRRAPLVVVHARAVASSPYAPGRAAPPVLPPARELDATPEPAQRAVALLRRDHPALPVSLELVDDDPARAVVGAGRRAQLVVVGSRGLGGLRGALVGSVSSEVLREADCTVLVVHQRCATGTEHGADVVGPGHARPPRT